MEDLGRSFAHTALQLSVGVGAGVVLELAFGWLEDFSGMPHEPQCFTDVLLLGGESLLQLALAGLVAGRILEGWTAAGEDPGNGLSLAVALMGSQPRLIRKVSLISQFILRFLEGMLLPQTRDSRKTLQAQPRGGPAIDVVSHGSNKGGFL